MVVDQTRFTVRVESPSPAVAGITHHRAALNGTQLHYVSAGTSGSPVLLVHGFPESWWAFHKLIPLLAPTHRVFAVDLRGFGDSSNAKGDYTAPRPQKTCTSSSRTSVSGPCT